MNRKTEEHSFSIEMKSKHSVKRMSFFDEETGRVLFEGFLGSLKNVAMVEKAMLEIEGSKGTLKLDISQQEMERCLTPQSKPDGGGKQR
jgi:hypothetical protein